MTDALLVFTTLPSADKAAEIAKVLVEEKLVACANLLPAVRSIYRWQQAVHNDPEFLLVIKTTAERAAQLRSVINELHPYELPECIQLTVEGGSEEYLAWLTAESGNGE